MSTILHPSFRLKLFSHCWPAESLRAEKLLERHFSKRRDLMRKQEQNKTGISKKSSPAVNPENIFELFTSPQSTDESKELEAYTKNIDRIPGPSAKDAKALLRWWKD
ncbi:hypothetical protein H4Q26_013894 [Puccinia striiformis f. sp. tritici PST-130]|nr:hypothetical protein H4Q26_013894 [Puccinia striiformis f. sp. tritici PST-130]